MFFGLESEIKYSNYDLQQSVLDETRNSNAETGTPTLLYNLTLLAQNGSAICGSRRMKAIDIIAIVMYRLF